MDQGRRCEVKTPPRPLTIPPSRPQTAAEAAIEAGFAVLARAIANAEPRPEGKRR